MSKIRKTLTATALAPAALASGYMIGKSAIKKGNEFVTDQGKKLRSFVIDKANATPNEKVTHMKTYLDKFRDKSINMKEKLDNQSGIKGSIKHTVGQVGEYVKDHPKVMAATAALGAGATGLALGKRLGKHLDKRKS